MTKGSDDGHFDVDAGEAGKREGMERAERAADPEWRRAFLICAQDVARRLPWFNTDAIEQLRRERYPNATTHEYRAIGPLMREVQKLGYCVRTDDYYESTQKQCHRRPKQMWRSLIYQGRQPMIRHRRRVLDPRQADLFDVRKKS